MAIVRRTGVSGVGYSTLGAQLMDRQQARREARRAARETREFQAEEAALARDASIQQAEAERDARAAAAAQSQQAALDRAMLGEAGAAGRQQTGIEARQDAVAQGQAFKSGQEAMAYALNSETYSPTQLSEMTKIRADLAHIAIDPTYTEETRETARKQLQTKFQAIWDSPAGEIKKKEPTPQEDFDGKTVEWEGAKFTRDQNGVWKKIHEPKAEIAARTAAAKAESEQTKHVHDLEKDLDKLLAEKRKYEVGLEGEMSGKNKDKKAYDFKTIRRMSAAKYNGYIMEKEAEIYEAQQGRAEAGAEDFFPERTPFGAAVERAGVPAPIEAPPEPPPPPAPGSPEAARAAIPVTPADIKQSGTAAIQAFRELTPELLAGLAPEAQRAYELLLPRIQKFMDRPASSRILGMEQMPFQLRAMIAAIVAKAQGEVNVGTE